MAHEENRINIGKLLINASEAEEVQLNPAKNFTSGDWKRALSYLKRYRPQPGKLDNMYGKIAFNLITFLPDRREDFKLDQELLDGFKWSFLRYGQVGNFGDTLRLGAQIKALYKTKHQFIADYDSMLDSGITKEIDARIEPHTTSDLFHYKVLNPDVDIEEIFPSLRFKEIEDNLQNWFNFDLLTYAHCAADTRLLFPDRTIKTPSHFWEQARSEWDSLRDVERSRKQKGAVPFMQFTLFARSLAILGADRAVIDDNGINLAFDNKLNVSRHPELPSAKKYALPTTKLARRF